MNKKVIIVSYGLSMGGLQRASCVLANHLSFRVNVVFYCITKADHFFNLNPAIRIIEPVKQFSVFSTSFFFALKSLRNTLITEKPDAVLVFGKFLGAFTMLASLRLSTRIVLTERMSPIRKERLNINLFNRIAFWLKNPDGIIAQTMIASIYQRSFFNSKVPIVVIPNALREVQLFPEIHRKNQILAVGRMGDHLKGFDRLIEAFAKIKNKEWTLVFAGGDDDDDNYLNALINKLGLGERIVFLGKIKNIDLVYAESGIFVIPSRSEGFPNALCEAMSAGLPCISFDFIAGPRELIMSGENGIIVPDGDIIALAESINHLIANPDERERLGKNAMEIRQKLDSGIITNRILDFLIK